MKSIGETGFHVEPKFNLVWILVTRKNQKVSEDHKAL